MNAFFNEIAREASKEWTPNGSYLHKRLSAVELLVLKKACKETPLYKKQGSNADAAFARWKVKYGIYMSFTLVVWGFCSKIIAPTSLYI